MLAIRMQRTGRKGHAMFRVVVQESRLTPTSGKVVALLGSYDPHTKKAVITKDKAEFYLKNGAQPSDRAARILQAEGVTMPVWFTKADEKKRTTRYPEKLRRNQPEQPKTEDAPVAGIEEAPVQEAVDTPEAEEVKADA